MLRPKLHRNMGNKPKRHRLQHDIFQPASMILALSALHGVKVRTYEHGHLACHDGCQCSAGAANPYWLLRCEPAGKLHGSCQTPGGYEAGNFLRPHVCSELSSLEFRFEKVLPCLWRLSRGKHLLVVSRHLKAG